MRLKNKIFIVVSLTWIFFLCLTYLAAKPFFVNRFLELEQRRADENLSRVDQALDQINYSLATFTADWSHWNDLYYYMKGKNPKFISDNLNMSAFVNSHINLMTYWDNKGRLVSGTTVNTEQQLFIPFPKHIGHNLFSYSLLLQKNHDHNARGYILLESDIMLIASSLITDSRKLLPPVGVSIFGRNLDQSLINKLIELTQVNLTLLLPNQIKQSDDFSSIFKYITTSKSGHATKPKDSDYLYGYTLIKDINMKPIAMFQMTTPRIIYRNGLQTINYYLLSLFMLAILFSILLMKLIQELVTKRLERLDAQLALISAKKDITLRVPVEGSDELTSVSTEINYLLSVIEVSQENLEGYVQERTKELQYTNTKLQKEITERKTVEQELVLHKQHLSRIAHYDSLTSLPNRLYFNDILNKAIQYAKRHTKMLAILFIDLDRFKNINDAFGHNFGDAVLKEVASRFSLVVRSGDVIARLSGDEFIVLLNNIGAAKYAAVVAEKILKTCLQPIKLDNHEIFLNTSIGISIYPTDGESIEDVQKNADIAMYKAKKNGGSNYLFYTSELDLLAHEYIRLETALRNAIINHEFVLYFQPQFNLITQKINRVEVLIRWQHPTIGLISPMKFIPLAEETGLITEIGQWVLFEACRIAKEWQNKKLDPIIVSVNLSAKQFRHQDISQLVSNALKESELASQYLELELTESAVMDNADFVIDKLNVINDMGVNIAIDDFGTGYTSINYLRHLPLSIIKIDRTFIKGLPHCQDDVTITCAILLLAHQLGFEVVAEGVETIEQMEFLRNKGCEMIQGYYISPPLPIDKLENFIQTFEKIWSI